MSRQWTTRQRERQRAIAFDAFKKRAAADPDIHPVRRARLDREMTQPELAARVGVGTEVIVKVERRQYVFRPHAKTRNGLAEVLDLRPEEVAGG